MPWARSVSSRSGPAGPSPKSIRTAPRRASVSGGGTNRVSSSAVIGRAPSAIGSSQPGRLSLGRLEVGADQLLQLFAGDVISTYS